MPNSSPLVATAAEAELVATWTQLREACPDVFALPRPVPLARRVNSNVFTSSAAANDAASAEKNNSETSESARQSVAAELPHADIVFDVLQRVEAEGRLQPWSGIPRDDDGVSPPQRAYTELGYACARHVMWLLESALHDDEFCSGDAVRARKIFNAFGGPLPFNNDDDLIENGSGCDENAFEDTASGTGGATNVASPRPTRHPRRRVLSLLSWGGYVLVAPRWLRRIAADALWSAWLLVDVDAEDPLFNRNANIDVDDGELMDAGGASSARAGLTTSNGHESVGSPHRRRGGANWRGGATGNEVPNDASTNVGQRWQRPSSSLHRREPMFSRLRAARRFFTSKDNPFRREWYQTMNALDRRIVFIDRRNMLALGAHIWNGFRKQLFVVSLIPTLLYGAVWMSQNASKVDVKASFSAIATNIAVALHRPGAWHDAEFLSWRGQGKPGATGQGRSVDGWQRWAVTTGNAMFDAFSALARRWDTLWKSLLALVATSTGFRHVVFGVASWRSVRPTTVVASDEPAASSQGAVSAHVASTVASSIVHAHADGQQQQQLTAHATTTAASAVNSNHAPLATDNLAAEQSPILTSDAVDAVAGVVSSPPSVESGRRALTVHATAGALLLAVEVARITALNACTLVVDVILKHSVAARIADLTARTTNALARAPLSFFDRTPPAMVDRILQSPKNLSLVESKIRQHLVAVVMHSMLVWRGTRALCDDLITTASNATPMTTTPSSDLMPEIARRALSTLSQYPRASCVTSLILCVALTRATETVGTRYVAWANARRLSALDRLRQRTESLRQEIMFEANRRKSAAPRPFSQSADRRAKNSDDGVDKGVVVTSSDNPRDRAPEGRIPVAASPELWDETPMAQMGDGLAPLSIFGSIRTRTDVVKNIRLLRNHGAESALLLPNGDDDDDDDGGENDGGGDDRGGVDASRLTQQGRAMMAKTAGRRSNGRRDARRSDAIRAVLLRHLAQRREKTTALLLPRDNLQSNEGNSKDDNDVVDDDITAKPSRHGLWRWSLFFVSVAHACGDILRQAANIALHPSLWPLAIAEQLRRTGLWEVAAAQLGLSRPFLALLVLGRATATSVSIAEHVGWTTRMWLTTRIAVLEVEQFAMAVVPSICTAASNVASFALPVMMGQLAQVMTDGRVNGVLWSETYQSWSKLVMALIAGRKFYRECRGHAHMAHYIRRLLSAASNNDDDTDSNSIESGEKRRTTDANNVGASSAKNSTDTISVSASSSSNRDDIPTAVLFADEFRLDAIVLRHVTFSYPSRPDIVVLRNLTLEIPASPGSIVALTGPSGCGKSTVLALAMRLYKLNRLSTTNIGAGLLNEAVFEEEKSATATPPRGTVALRLRFRQPNDETRRGSRPTESPDEAVEEVSVEEFDETVLRRDLFGYVPQTSTMVHGATIAENIALKRCLPTDAATNARLDAVTHASGCADFVRGLREGVHTRLTTQSVVLSGGQAQRLAFARAMWREPLVLLADEPSASLDDASFATLLSNMRRMVSGVAADRADATTNRTPTTSNEFYAATSSVASPPRRSCIIAVTHDARLIAAADVVVRWPTGGASS